MIRYDVVVLDHFLQRLWVALVAHYMFQYSASYSLRFRSRVANRLFLLEDMLVVPFVVVVLLDTFVGKASTVDADHVALAVRLHDLVLADVLVLPPPGVFCSMLLLLPVPQTLLPVVEEKRLVD